MATFDRGEIWLADLGIAAKIRPCLVMALVEQAVKRWLGL